jgi:hypothetical protein
LKRVIGLKHSNLVTNSAALITPNDFTMLQHYAGDQYKTLYDLLEDRREQKCPFSEPEIVKIVQ